MIIKGLTWYETITDGLGDTFHGGGGAKIRLTEAQVDSGLTLTSYYRGTHHPVNTLTIVAKDTIDGVTALSDTQTIVVTDPPPAASSVSSSPVSGGADWRCCASIWPATSAMGPAARCRARPPPPTRIAGPLSCPLRVTELPGLDRGKGAVDLHGGTRRVTVGGVLRA